MFKKHIDELVKKLRLKFGFFYRNRSCLSLRRKQIIKSTFLSALYYGDFIYQSTAATTLQPLDAIYHSALCFVTVDSFDTHQYILYQKVGLTLLKTRRSLHYFIFVYNALLHKLPSYLTFLLKYRQYNIVLHILTFLLIHIH